jgi:mono/diheme cytochrome c family protein
MKPRSSLVFFMTGISALVVSACASSPSSASGSGSPLTANPVAAAPTPAPAPIVAKVDFVKQVAPLFEAYCYQCHGNGKSRGGLQIDQKANLLKHLVPGDPDHSDIYRAITRSVDASDHMPPVSEDQPEDDDIATIKQWIAEGAVCPDSP